LRFVAFYRNVNLGQPRSPTRPQLEAALAEAGAEGAASFQTNGTIVFAAADEAVALAVVSAANAALSRVCGLREPAYIAPLDHLAGLVAETPFAGIDGPDIYEHAATFGPPGAFAALRLPLATPRGDVELLRVTPYIALSICRKVIAAPGAATPFLERTLGVPVTTRSWTTITRLVRKHC
jgi:uncharacterized protein (DUF1697 family)